MTTARGLGSTKRIGIQIKRVELNSETGTKPLHLGNTVHPYWALR